MSKNKRQKFSKPKLKRSGPDRKQRAAQYVGDTPSEAFKAAAPVVGILGQTQELLDQAFQRGQRLWEGAGVASGGKQPDGGPLGPVATDALLAYYEVSQAILDSLLDRRTGNAPTVDELSNVPMSTPAAGAYSLRFRLKTKRAATLDARVDVAPAMLAVSDLRRRDDIIPVTVKHRKKHTLLDIEVQDHQAAGTYRGLLYDDETAVRCGEIAVKIY